jgi:Tfp pilus assembly protein PilN
MRAVNLIPSEQRSGGTVGTRSNGAAFVVLGLLAGLVLMAGLYGIARHQVSSRTSQVTELTAQAQQAQARAQALAPYASFMAMREQRLQAVSQLVGDRFDWSHALHEIGRVLPYDASLSSVQGTIGTTSGSTSSAAPPASALTTTPAASTKTAASTSVASATPPGATPTFTIAGCAVSQSEVARTLVRLHQMDGVSNVVLQSSTKAGSTAGSGTCPSGDPAFSVQVTFQPLPSPAALNPGAFGSTTPASSAGGSSTASRSTVSAVSSGSPR